MLRRYLPILDWGRRYTGQAFGNDALAAVIVTIMLIPQSLAYALLAGLPPQAGIYASILPIILYAIFGTSRALAVGPVAVVSLLTASAVGQVAEQGTAGYAVAALTLAGLSGGFLVLLGVFRLGMLANFLSHPVIAGFITASGILIAASQLRHILGVEAEGHTLIEMVGSLAANIGQTNPYTLAIGIAATAFLFWVRRGMKTALRGRGVPARAADIATKAGPVFAVIATTVVVWLFSLNDAGVSVVGDVPKGLPPLTLPGLSPDLIRQLLIPAILISIIGFVESISVAQTLAAKRRERINPNQELIGLGAANLGAAFTGGYPVTGGFARSAVNDDAGAETPAAGAYTALGLALAAAFLTPLVFYLPKATLAATIIVAVLGLVDLSILRRTWSYAGADFAAVAITILLTLGAGVEIGVATGVVVSLLLHLIKTSKPHVAIVGLVPGTHHFRNIDRHDVQTCPRLLTIRIDESLYFVNAQFLETLIQDRVADDSTLRHVVLMCPAVNSIDFSALESLEAVNRRLTDLGIGFHLSEVKGPVMDRLQTTHFLDALNGRVFLSQYDAWSELAGASSKSAIQ
ncbi:putative sulfate transporter/MT1781 [Rhodobacteraceae bacterium THAF1]|uniref:SulP family inorganic anion transporter n=1 Tax=Palleronia sp. THAF1 TaxID=2587842 RepID=UPI000F3F7F4D|nr:sulfate permease [Palleronia sp. THAF1]QFU08160.1 putative sulfate transporter [Palleronia sp. THAF1]VDC28711.1 putative sulfate transporter/MT1781 [Rhodobacteraceae bacterium THAF1]